MQLLVYLIGTNVVYLWEPGVKRVDGVLRYYVGDHIIYTDSILLDIHTTVDIGANTYAEYFSINSTLADLLKNEV